MLEEKSEGIILRSLDYKDRQRIITVFSREAGIISLIIKGLSKRNYRLLALSSPFCRAEFIYRKGSSDLFRFIDGSVLDEHLIFRKKLSFIQTAGTLSQAILRSQMPGKPAPALYSLLCSYFQQIPSFEEFFTLVASFHLKLLKHEGLTALSKECSHCKEFPARFLEKGESLCHVHSTPHALCFTTEEWDTLHFLENAQQFHALRNLKLSLQLPARIASYFQEQISAY
jgi:DNA repair protein RecO (recombination protein O)